MLTRGEAKVPLNALLLLSILAVISSLAATTMTIVYKYLGFGIYNNPITCVSSNAYFIQKYNHNYYLTAINITEVLAVMTNTALLVVVAVLRVKLSKLMDQPDQIFQTWNNQAHIVLYLLPSISIVFLVIPTAYFFSFVIQVGGSCNSSVLIEWIIIGALATLALVLLLASTFVAFKLRQKFDPPKEETVLSRVKQTNKQGLSAKHQIQNQENEAIKQQQLAQSQINKLLQIEDDPTNRQLLKSQNLKKTPQQSQARSQLRQPLITVLQPPHSHKSKSQKQYSELEKQERQKLQTLRKQRLQQQKKIQQLKRKVFEDKEKKDDKSPGNQTIINIHLDGSRTGEITKKQVDGAPQQRIRNKKQAYEALRSPIYEEQYSQDSEYYHVKQNGQRPIDDRRFYSKNQYEPKETDPYKYRNQAQIAKQKLKRHPSQQISTVSPRPAKKLSLGHLASVKIAPPISPQPISSFVSAPKRQVSQVHNVLPNEKQEQSFYKQLVQDSAARQKGLQLLRAPKKGKVPKDTPLEAYIEALNLSMNVNRPDYENNYHSNGSEVSYNSVLSNRVGAGMPAQRDDHSRRDPMMHPISRENNVLAMANKIQQKYKRN